MGCWVVPGQKDDCTQDSSPQEKAWVWQGEGGSYTHRIMEVYKTHRQDKQPYEMYEWHEQKMSTKQRAWDEMSLNMDVLQFF